MRLAYITDEATQDLRQAAELAKKLGFSGVELRSVEDTPIDRIPIRRLREYRRLLDGEGLAVCDLASSFYKCPLAEAPGELDKLKRLCDGAEELGCGHIRGFAFFAQGAPAVTDEILDAFGPAGEILRERGKRLLLEADPSVNTPNHAALGALLARLDAPEFGAIYDPGNDLYDPGRERPYPEGYLAVKPWLAHVHIKDALLNAAGEPECVKIGTGWVDYPGLLAALRRDGYKGYLSLETHYRVGAGISEALMRQPGGAAFSQGGMAATVESAQALRKLLEEGAPCAM